MTAEQGEPDDMGHMPSMSKKAREIGKLQDMYRRTLAASWAAQAGELPADKCIENIFAGGDGWSGEKEAGASPGLKQSGYSTEENESGGDRKVTNRRHHRKMSSYGGSTAKKPSASSHHTRNRSKGEDRGVSGRTSIEQQVRSSSAETRRSGFGHSHEVDEFVAREDLKSWVISSHG